MAYEPGDEVEIASELRGLSDLRRDSVVYKEHTLAMSPHPRFVPSYFDDSEVSEVLHLMASQVRLPWLLDEAEFEQLWESVQ
jgi:hypothetical protein